MLTKKHHVLVIDDSRTQRNLLCKVLEIAGYTTSAVENGEEALKIMQQTDFDAILLDVEMPGMDGFTTCAEIRKLPRGQYAPIMIVTGLEDMASIHKAYLSGATDFTTKPINWDIISYRIQYMIRTNQDFMELQRSKAKLLEAQQYIENTNQMLEERVTERTKQLASANQELQQTLETLQATHKQLLDAEKMASLGSMVAGIAHEVNTPLGISVTSSSILADALARLATEFENGTLKRSSFNEFIKSCREALQLLQMNLQRAAELIKNFKQVSADQTNEARRQFQLKDYLEQIITSLQPPLRQTQLTTSIDCTADLIIDSYPGALFQVITILVMNSITHGFDNAADANGTIRIQVTTQQQQVTIYYADSGKGIAAENLNKIFEPFFTTRRNNGGIGLGLHIAYNLVAQVLCGNLRCESTLGKGATFIITFPMTASSH